MNQSPDQSGIERLGSGQSEVPLPHRRWTLRYGVPIFFIGVATSMLLITGWNAIRPVQDVDATAVVIRPVETSTPNRTTGSSLVQAPGWVEADPFSTYVPALTTGIVKNVMVLEGDQVTTGQIVATLVDDDARLELDHANAILTQRNGELQAAQAAFSAAETELQELVSLTRRESVATAETARLAAELTAYPAKITQAEATIESLRDEYDRKVKLVGDGAVAAGPVTRLGIRLKSAEAALQALHSEQKAVSARHDAAIAEEIAARRDRELLIHETLELESAKANKFIAQGAVDSAKVEVAKAAVAAATEAMGGSGPCVTLARVPLGENCSSPCSAGTASHGICSGIGDHALLVLRLNVEVPLLTSSPEKAKSGTPADGEPS